MATSNPVIARTGSAMLRRPWSRTAWQYAAVLPSVLLCYGFAWIWLRELTLRANLAFDALFGVHLQVLTPLSVSWQGHLFDYRIACTFVDVWFGAWPLLWSWRKPLVANVAVILGLAPVLFAFNIVRLTISDVLFAKGVPWAVAHGGLGGVCYFVVWVLIERYRAREAGAV